MHMVWDDGAPKACCSTGESGAPKYSVPNTQAQYQVQGGLLVDAVVSQSPAVLRLLSGEDQSMLIWGDYPPQLVAMDHEKQGTKGGRGVKITIPISTQKT